MADTPNLPPPDAREQPILERLLAIRDELTLLKSDRTQYIKSGDVMPLYERVVDEVRALNQIRAEKPPQEESRRKQLKWFCEKCGLLCEIGSPPGCPNLHDLVSYETRGSIYRVVDLSTEAGSKFFENLRKKGQDNPILISILVDGVLDGCFQLISLFFMTIGRNNEAPAAYALTSTIKRLLHHLTQVDLYSAKDLEHISLTLVKIRETIENSGEKYSPKLLTLLSTRVDSLQASLDNLTSRLDRLKGDLPLIHEKLISILRSMSAANTHSKFSTSDVKKLQEQLKEIDALRVDNKFVGADGEVPEGNDEVCELLAKCLKWSEMVLERKGEIPTAFMPQYKGLTTIRNTLQKLTLTQAWSLRETDLYDFQRQLDRYDESRVDENFVDEEGNFADLYVQRTLLYLIRRSYGYVYHLMVSSEPVSEALIPIYNQLQTLKRCLLELREAGGVSSPRELYPYSMKLNSLDNMRVNGKFLFGGEIPEGQGSLNELLADCYEISYEMRVDAEAEGEQGEN